MAPFVKGHKTNVGRKGVGKKKVKAEHLDVIEGELVVKPKYKNYHEPVVRKKVYTKDDKRAIYKQLVDYIRKTDIPKMSEFCYKNEVVSTTINAWPEFKDILQHLKDKKEAAVEDLVFKGKMHPSTAIFTLKQFGWADERSIVQKGAIKHNVQIKVFNRDQLINKPKKK